MKWFKHFSDSLDDPFIQDLMDEFGHFGYAVWFGLIEIIAKENGNTVTGKLSVSPAYLRRKLRSTPTRLRQVFDYCQTSVRLTVDYSEKEWNFDFPKMVKIKDNYTQDLEATKKKVSLEEEVEEEKEEEVDKKKIYGSYFNVKLKDKELEKLQEKLGKVETDKWIETLSEGMALKTYSYKSHYLAILRWVKNEKERTGEMGKEQKQEQSKINREEQERQIEINKKKFLEKENNG